MSLPLFERYPALTALPWVELASLPTPLDVRIAPGFHALSVKRDDLTSTVYGGNKVRKLEFLLGKVVAEKRVAVVTFGAYGSNHALATALYARKLGLEPHVVLSPQAPGPFAAATLRAHAALGTVLHPIDGWDGARDAVLVKRQLTERDGVEPAIIPMGGTSALGAVGYVNAAFEIADQTAAGRRSDAGATPDARDAASPVPAPDVVYVAGGTLGTAVGLAIGFAAERMPTRVVAVRVTPDTVGSDAFAESLAAQTIELLCSVDPAFPALDFADLAFELRHDWFEPGYGVVTPETTSAVEFMAQLGYKAETTYTGKAVAAMLADAQSGRLEGAHVMFLDTYNSAPMPAPGSDSELPPVLQEYVALCDAEFGSKGGAR